MYAVIETGGKQYRVAPGEFYRNRDAGGRCGRGGRVWPRARPGRRRLRQGRRGCRWRPVKGTITAHGRGDKILVFKFKRKKQYKRTIGHRQDFTEVTVRDIVA